MKMLGAKTMYIFAHVFYEVALHVIYDDHNSGKMMYPRNTNICVNFSSFPPPREDAARVQVC